MKATLDSLCYEMEKAPADEKVQIKCISSLLTVLPSEKDEAIFTRAFNCIVEAIRSNEDNSEIIVQALKLFSGLLENPSLIQYIQNTEIPEILVLILTQVKSEPDFTEYALTAIVPAINQKCFRDQFSTIEFVKMLVEITRLNSKSETHGMLLINIAAKLDTNLGKPLQKLCSSLIVMSRNFKKNEKLQTKLVKTFTYLGVPDIMEHVASITIPHFIEMVQRFDQNFILFKGTLILAVRSPADCCSPALVDLIADRYKELKEDVETLTIAINLLSTKIAAKDFKITILPLTTYSLSTFISDPNMIKSILTICYRSISMSTNGAKTDTVKFTNTLTSIILIYIQNHSIIRRATGILMKMSSDIDALTQAAVPYTLIQAAAQNIDHNETVSTIIQALSLFIDKSKYLAGQLHRIEHINALKNILSQNPTEVNVIVILHAICLSIYEYDRFLELSPERASLYQVDAEICCKIIDSNLNKHKIVRSAMLLMSKSGENKSSISKAMVKYSSDKEIQLSGLHHQVQDLQALNVALSLCNEPSLKYVIPLLKISNDQLPTQIIEQLLRYDRIDVVDVLRAHVKKKSAKQIGNQFELLFPSQITLAHDLYLLKLWEPSEANYEMITTSMFESLYNEEQLKDSLLFIKLFGIGDSSLPFLISAMKQYPKNPTIVTICAEFICSFQPSDDIERECLECNAVAVASYALQFNKGNEETAYQLIKDFHCFSFFSSLDDMFADSLVVPLLVKTAQLSDRCNAEACETFVNIISNEAIVKSLLASGAVNVAFKHFTPKAYELVTELLDRTELVLSSEQFKLVVKELTDSRIQFTSSQAYHLLKIILNCFEMDVNSKQKLNFRVLSSILTIYLTDPIIVELVAKILPFTKGFNNDDDLLFSLIESLRANAGKKEVVEAIIPLLPQFEKQKNTIGAAATVELFMQLVARYPRDVVICTNIFRMLKGHAESFPVALYALSNQRDEEALIAISQCILSVSEMNDPSDGVPRILNAIKKHNDKARICANLLPVLYMASTNDSSHSALMKNLPIILNTATRHISNVFIAQSVTGMICNLSEKQHNVSELASVPRVLIMLLRVWGKDKQFLSACCLAISNFTAASKGSLFVEAIPSLILALKQHILVREVCTTIIDMSDNINEFAAAITEELMMLIKKEPMNEKIVPAKCLLSIIHCKGSEEAVFSKIAIIFETIKAEDSTQELILVLLKICALLNDETKMKSFDPFITNLISFVRGTEKELAIGAASVCMTISRLFPIILLHFVDIFRLMAESSGGELKHLCNAITGQLTGN